MAEIRTTSGKPLHPIGIGTWDIGSRFDPVKRAVAVYGREDREIDALRYSLSQGQNHIDTAEMYGAGHTDEIVGEAIKSSSRKDLYLADKLWKNSVGRGQVRRSVETMLKRLGTDYIDLLYIHTPWEDAPWTEAIPQINDLIDEGLVRHFGVSSFTVSDMKQTQKLSRHPIVANQLHYNVLYKQAANEAVRTFCAKNNIAVVAYRPVERMDVQNHQVIQEIAAAHHVSPAQVAIAWLLSRDALPIPKSVQKPHIDENLAAMDIVLTKGELERLDAL